MDIFSTFSYDALNSSLENCAIILISLLNVEFALTFKLSNKLFIKFKLLPKISFTSFVFLVNLSSPEFNKPSFTISLIVYPYFYIKLSISFKLLSDSLGLNTRPKSLSSNNKFILFIT